MKSVIEITKLLFDLSPFHEVTIGLKRQYISKICIRFKKMYLDQNPPFSHTTSTFRLDLDK